MKLEKEVNDSSLSGTVNAYYAGNYIYKKGNSHGQSDVALTFFNSEEGYIEPVFEQETTTTTFGTTIVERLVGFEYTYQYKDHLGNIRLAYQDMNGDGVISAETEIKEENHYYPFGLKHKGYNSQIVGRDHNYGFGGKEEQSELGLEWIDITARNYDASLGRWMNLDPLAEKMRKHSPYNYAFDNPIFFIDPDGMEPIASSEEEVDPVKKKTKIDKEVQATKDLGETEISSMSIIFHDDGTVELQVEISVGVNRELDSGSDLDKENPGLKNEVEIHENKHFDQISEILEEEEYGFLFGDKSFTGCLDECTKEFVKYANKLETKEKRRQAFFNFFKQIKDQTTTKLDNKYEDRDGVERNAVERADKAIRSNGSEPEYQNVNRKNKTIKKNGKILPNS